MKSVGPVLIYAAFLFGASILKISIEDARIACPDFHLREEIESCDPVDHDLALLARFALTTIYKPRVAPPPSFELAPREFSLDEATSTPPVRRYFLIDAVDDS